MGPVVGLRLRFTLPLVGLVQAFRACRSGHERDPRLETETAPPLEGGADQLHQDWSRALDRAQPDAPSPKSDHKRFVHQIALI